VSDQNQILRLLGTIREECAEMRHRQEELYELLISYKDQVHDLKQTVVESLAGLPKSPYIAGQLVPAPDHLGGVDDFRDLLSTYLHRTTEDSDPEAGPTDTAYDPPPEVKPEDIKLEPSEDRPRRRRNGGGGGGKRRPRDMDLERGPDRGIEQIDLDDDDDDKPRRRGGRRRRRGGRGKKSAVDD
jgi:hypothetical protein